MRHQLRLLNGERHLAFLALRDAHIERHSPPLGIAITNALSLGSNTRRYGQFLEASHVNRSCRDGNHHSRCSGHQRGRRNNNQLLGGLRGTRRSPEAPLRQVLLN
ncbi:hypothetical protein F5Y13DRAFT_170492 [Hypoxylon sp. FL1857]|nr:hypothetical protein F5Y13DRAFT_170492 [Hypoxylon sp. FL1857]